MNRAWAITALNLISIPSKSYVVDTCICIRILNVLTFAYQVHSILMPLLRSPADMNITQPASYVNDSR